MLLNEKKSSYMIFSRSKSEFNAKLTLNDVTLERMSVFRVLGVWPEDNRKGDYITKEICIQAYNRFQIINRLKFAGISERVILTI